MQCDFARLLVVHGVDCAREERGVGWEFPKTDFGERHSGDDVVVFRRVGLEGEFGVGFAPVDGDLLGCRVVGHA